MSRTPRAAACGAAPLHAKRRGQPPLHAGEDGPSQRKSGDGLNAGGAAPAVDGDSCHDCEPSHRGRLAAVHTMGDTRRLESAAIAGGAEPDLSVVVA